MSKQITVIRSGESRKRGFTLVEIMAAATIMLILIGVSLQLTSTVLQSFSRATNKLSANAEARQIF